MYSMTGSGASASSDDGLGREPQPAAGLRGVARRIWRGPAEAPAEVTEQHQISPAGTGHAENGTGPASPDATVPPLLQRTAAWSWRLLLTGLVIYLAFKFAVTLRLVVLPFIAAVLLTSALQPITSWLKHKGLAPLAATWCTFFGAIVVIAGAATLFTDQVSNDYQTLAGEVTKTAHQVEHSLAGPPFHLNAPRLQHLTNEMVNYISQHKGAIAGTVLTGSKYALELAAGIVLTLFISFFLIKDGAKIWEWLIRGFRPDAKRRAHRAGEAAWKALTNYIRGTVLIAAIHAVFIGLALWLLGVPLLVPFIVLIFIAAFVPLVGILVVGALIILVTLATKGWVAAVIVLAVFILENQIEGHLLQPLVVGRLVRLHPLAIILALSVGGILAGIPGAIIAVPFAAVVTYAGAALRQDPGPD
jgi:predicted PurR-regulated permease PerM